LKKSSFTNIFYKSLLRKRFKERAINYYNSCEIMEAKFVAGMYGGK